jgi:uncharacterized protein with von Willebrand factor type A (vWA) domain
VWLRKQRLRLLVWLIYKFLEDKPKEKNIAMTHCLDGRLFESQAVRRERLFKIDVVLATLVDYNRLLGEAIKAVNNKQLIRFTDHDIHERSVSLEAFFLKEDCYCAVNDELETFSERIRTCISLNDRMEHVEFVSNDEFNKLQLRKLVTSAMLIVTQLISYATHSRKE